MTVVLMVVSAVFAAACGSSDESAAPTPSSTTPAPTSTPTSTPASAPTSNTEPVAEVVDESIALPARQATAADPAIAGSSVSAFGVDVFSSADAGDENLLLSPLSIAIALAMLEPGASGDAIGQLHDVLRIGDPAEWHASMNALEQALERRTSEFDDGETEIVVANAAFFQPGYPFTPDYLDTIGTSYGAVLEELDFAADQDAAAERINGFVADATDGAITDLVSADTINPRTVLALVNALLLRASWLEAFQGGRTVDTEFTRLDGEQISVAMMNGRSDRSGRGDGWIAASKQLVGGLRLDVVVPDTGRFDEVAASLGDVMAIVDTMPNPGAELGLPRFEVRVDVELVPALRDTGLTAVFEPGSLLRTADDPLLYVYETLHQTWMSVDEDGIEAAAATIVLEMPASEPVDPPIPVIVDRPFLLRIVDTASGAPLFLGQITDPTA